MSGRAPRSVVAVAGKSEKWGRASRRFYDTIGALIGGVKVGYSQRGEGLKPIEISVALPRSERTLDERILSTPLPAGGTARQGANVELGDVVSVKRERASYPIFRHNGRFAEMVTADVAGRFEAPVYGMLAVQDAIAKMDWGKDGPPEIKYHGQPVDDSKPTLLWDGEWEVTYVTFRDMGAAFMVAILGIYLLVVAQFGSFLLPLVILAPVPLTLIGILHRPLAAQRGLHRDLDDRLHRARRHHRAQLDPAGRFHPAYPGRTRHPPARGLAQGRRDPLQADRPDRGGRDDRRGLHPDRPDLPGPGDLARLRPRLVHGADGARHPGDLCLAEGRRARFGVRSRRAKASGARRRDRRHDGLATAPRFQQAATPFSKMRMVWGVQPAGVRIIGVESAGAGADSAGQPFPGADSTFSRPCGGFSGRSSPAAGEKVRMRGRATSRSGQSPSPSPQPSPR